MFNTIQELKKKDFEQAIQTIQKLYIDTCNMNENLTKQIHEYDKDDEIQKLKNEIKNINEKSSYMIFSISEEEEKDIEKWKNKHIKERHNGNSYDGAIGGRFTYIFTPTSIGEVGQIKCSCGCSYYFRELE